MTAKRKPGETDDPHHSPDEGRRRFIAATISVGGLALLGRNALEVLADIDSTQLCFSRNHIWIKPEKKSWILGVTNHVQRTLGKVTCTYLPELNCKFSNDEKFGSIRSVDTFDLKMPVSG